MTFFPLLFIYSLISVLSHDSALLGLTGLETTWANEMNFVRNHAPGAESIYWPVVHSATDVHTYSLTHALKFFVDI